MMMKSIARLIQQTVRNMMPVLLLALISPVLAANSESGMTERLGAATEEVKEAGKTAIVEAETVWHRIDSQRLKNRSPDEIVAWIIVGLMVGGVAGMIGSMRREGFGPVVNMILGLVGAFLGGILVALFNMDFGWGPVLIRYEELVMALAGAVLVVIVVRLVHWKWKQNRLKKKA